MGVWWDRLRRICPGTLVLAALIALGGCKSGNSQTAPQPPAVQVADVVQKDVPVDRDFLGTLDGDTNAEIHAQVSGYIISQDYKEGSFVHTGQRLFKIDPRPFEAILRQAQANMARDITTANLNRLEAKRVMQLFQAGAATIDERDTSEAQAQVAGATVKADQAAVETAKLQLSYTDIVSPIDGIAGLAAAQVGDLVGPNAGVNPALTTVSSVNPIRALFYVSEQEHMAYLARYPNPTSRAAYEAQVHLQLILSNGDIWPYKGKFFTAQREVDLRTGTMKLLGTFPNPGNVLRPGQFARVRVTLTVKGALLVPQRAVSELQGSYQVEVVGDDNRVHTRMVEVGQKVGSDWIITKGVARGDRVVVEGVQKVRDGTPVTPQPYAPATQPASGPASQPALTIVSGQGLASACRFAKAGRRTQLAYVAPIASESSLTNRDLDACDDSRARRPRHIEPAGEGYG